MYVHRPPTRQRIPSDIPTSTSHRRLHTHCSGLRHLPAQHNSAAEGPIRQRRLAETALRPALAHEVWAQPIQNHRLPPWLATKDGKPLLPDGGGR